MEFNTLDISSETEKKVRSNALELFKNSPIPNNEILSNLGLFINRRTLSRFLLMYELYQKCLNVHGVIMEFGVRWGQNLALFSNLRGMLEPFNYNRKIIGFDTFAGFPSVSDKDSMKAGDYAVPENYEEYLKQVLDFHESESPISHIKKYELVKGDASVTLKKYLQEHPETIISMAYFDMDIYQPTKECLLLIKDHLTKGSVIGFDELNYHSWAGETIALKEAWGLDKFKIQRSKFGTLQSYIIYGD